jgi:transposase
MYKIILQKQGEETKQIKNAKEAATILGVHTETVRRWCRNKEDKIKNGYFVFTNTD